MILEGEDTAKSYSREEAVWI